MPKPAIKSADTHDILFFIKEGKFDEALNAADALIAREPGHAQAWHLKGTIYRQQGNHAQAMSAFNTALKHKPDFAQACLDLAQLLEQTLQITLAIKMYEHLLRIAPDTEKMATPDGEAKAWFEKGIALYQQRDLENAANAFGKTIALCPGFADALANLALVLYELHRVAEAKELCLCCLRMKPDQYQALNTLGLCCKEEGQHVCAVAAYRRSVAVQPDYFHAWHNLAKAYVEIPLYIKVEKDYDAEAIAAYERAHALDPGNAGILGGLVHMLELLCRWDKAEDLRKKLLRILSTTDKCAGPFIVTLYASAELQLANALRWSKKEFPAAQPYAAAAKLPADARGDGRLRIGYFSSDYHRHATVRLISEMFEHHDKSRFEIYAYSGGDDDGSAERARVRAAVTRFHDIRALDDKAAAELIRRDGIDILVDLKGYSHGERMKLMALRPAPLQMHYLGYPGTTGAAFIDYFIADAVAAPPSMDAMFSEKLIRLPQSYQINDRKRALPRPGTSRADYGLPAEGFVFCGFNHPYKINPDMFAVWMRLLRQVEGSVLWLYETGEEVRENLRRAAEKQGVDPSRILFVTIADHAVHMQRYGHADLFLDTFPVCGHTTASDALWCGVPVVTMAGDSFVSRVAASLLHAVGLPELIADGLNAYEALALELARDTGKMKALRKHLEDGRLTFPLFDSMAATRTIEASYLHAAALHRAGKPPSAFALSADLRII